ncbi:unnamed protein product [Bursaphelenchus okinawaensis]|uniref:Uncharacterized protein n=1 Tax=Bursaphelenchus okinawaensis TaxID=465554 RepID=A0A811LT39_9BILA|nr:unnamed protein product [Bursaphelenchus okinawaensis]CAG9128593.1 unnamed protein product [Bursaphelenchus okinawaensis]
MGDIVRILSFLLVSASYNALDLCEDDRFESPNNDFATFNDPLRMTAALGYSSVGIVVTNNTVQAQLRFKKNNFITLKFGLCTASFTIMKRRNELIIQDVETGKKSTTPHDEFKITFKNDSIIVGNTITIVVLCPTVFTKTKSKNGNGIVTSLLMELLATEWDENLVLSFNNTQLLAEHVAPPESALHNFVHRFESFSLSITMFVMGMIIGLLFGGILMITLYFVCMNKRRKKVIEIIMLEVECALRPLQMKEGSNEAKQRFMMETQEKRTKLHIAKAKLGLLPDIGTDSQTEQRTNRSMLDSPATDPNFKKD